MTGGKKALVFLLALITAGAPMPRALAVDITNYVQFNGLTADPISFPVTDRSLKFQVELRNITNDAETASFALVDVNGAQIDFDYAVFPIGSAARTTTHSLTIFAAKVSRASLPLRVLTTVRFSVESRRSPMSDAFQLNVLSDLRVVCKVGPSLTVATNTCGEFGVLQDSKTVEGYVNFATDLQRPIVLTRSVVVPLDLEIANPNRTLSYIELTLQDGKRNELTSTYFYPTTTADVSRFKPTLKFGGPDQIALPISLIVTVTFSTGSASITASRILNFNKTDICQNGPRFKKALNECPPGFLPLSDRLATPDSLTQLSKGSVVGANVTFYACIRKSRSTGSLTTLTTAIGAAPAWSSANPSALLMMPKRKAGGLRQGDVLVVNATGQGLQPGSGLPRLALLGYLKVGSC